MRVDAVELENVRGFLGGAGATRLEFPEAPGWYVFAGRNGSGKSTLLRAIALALAGPGFARQMMPSFAGWIREGAEEAKAKVSFVHDPRFDFFAGSGKPPKKAMEGGLVWKRPERGPEPQLVALPEWQSSALKGPWRGPWNENPQGWLVTGYGPFRRLTGHAADAQRVMVGPHHQSRLVSLFREDASLIEVVEWLKQLKFEQLEQRPNADQVLDGVLHSLNTGLLPDGARVTKVNSDGLWVERAGSEVELRQLSDGYRVALALVLDLIRQMFAANGSVQFDFEGNDGRVMNPAVVLIDEADAHLHVSWQQVFGDWLTHRFA